MKLYYLSYTVCVYMFVFLICCPAIPMMGPSSVQFRMACLQAAGCEEGRKRAHFKIMTQKWYISLSFTFH